MNTTSVPSWQVEPCPPWCVVGHVEEDLPADRVHQSASVEVPVVQLRGVGERPPRAGDQLAAVELAVVMHRRVGEVEAWLYVGDGRHQGLELAVGSWPAVAAAVRAVLAGA